VREALDIVGGTALTAPAVDDVLPIYDLSATANRKITTTDLFEVLNVFTEDATPDSANDFVLSYDASASTVKKVKMANLPAGSGLDINGLTEEATPVAGDFLPIYDVSATANRKINLNKLYYPGGTDVAIADGGHAASTVAGAQTNLELVGKMAMWIPASEFVPRITNGASRGIIELATNDNMLETLDFDTTTQEFAQAARRMPESWDEGTITFIPIWSHPSTSTNFGVVWALQAVAVSNDDAQDVAFGTEQTSTDTGGTTDDSYAGPECSAITVAGTPTAGDVVMFCVKRVPANGSDTLAVDARLHGVMLYITTNAVKDA